MKTTLMRLFWMASAWAFNLLEFYTYFIGARLVLDRDYEPGGFIISVLFVLPAFAFLADQVTPKAKPSHLSVLGAPHHGMEIGLCLYLASIGHFLAAALWIW